MNAFFKSGIGVVLVATMGYASAASTVKEPIIRILSYNIHHGAGMDKRLDLDRIATVIKSVSPDIVSLQEVDNKTGRTQGVDQAKELARLTGMHFIFGSSMDFGGGQYGNAVLTTLEIKESKVIPLPGEPRSALCVRLRTPGKKSSSKEFVFIATHLDTQKAPRLSSVALIEEGLKSYKGLPIVLAGDINAIPGSPTMLAFEKNWLNATHLKDLFTVPVKNPSKQIDYILCRPLGNWKIVQTKVLDEAIASDHRPLLAVLALQSTSASEDQNKSLNKPDEGDGK